MKFSEFIAEHTSSNLDLFVEENSHQILAISNFLENEEEKGITPTTPRIEDILSSIQFISLDIECMFPNSLRVILMFQDAYPTPGIACGIALATLNGRIQPSLSNFHKQIVKTYKPKDHPISSIDVAKYALSCEEFSEPLEKMKPLYSGDIRGWCTQGVLLCNAAPTTREGVVGAHVSEWSHFMKRLLMWLSDRFPYLVCAFFGRSAQTLSNHINPSKHTILSTSHPSNNGIASGFGTCNIFNEINTHLIKNKRPPIRWDQHSYL